LEFFYREVSGRIEWSTSLLNSLESISVNDLVEEVGGTYKYYCYVLANFDPIKAEQIYNSCTIDELTNAMVARHAYNKPRNEP